MTTALHDRRPDVLEAAQLHGWQRDTDTTRHGATSDQFTRGPLTLTVFWFASEWSTARYGMAYCDGGPDGPYRVPGGISGEHGVLAILAAS